MSGEGAKQVVDKVQAGWAPFREAVERLGADRLSETTPAGWTAKEMLATVAFWDEAAPGWIVMGLRRQQMPDGFAFGSGFVPPDDGTCLAPPMSSA